MWDVQREYAWNFKRGQRWTAAWPHVAVLVSLMHLHMCALYIRPPMRVQGFHCTSSGHQGFSVAEQLAHLRETSERCRSPSPVGIDAGLGPSRLCSVIMYRHSHMCLGMLTSVSSDITDQFGTGLPVVWAQRSRPGFCLRFLTV